ncbi:hypothetical protein Tco_0371095 [Tanacetum coccineum]
MNGKSRKKQVALIRFVLRMMEDDKSGCDLVFLIGGKSALGTSLDKEVRGCDVMITAVELETTLDVTELEVGCPGKVESGDGSKEGA